MKRSSLIRIASVLLIMQLTMISRAQSISDTTAIQNILQEEIVSWNNTRTGTIYVIHFGWNVLINRDNLKY